MAWWDWGRCRSRHQNATVTIQKLGGDAFVVLDLDGASRNIGPTRLAPKILTDGAELLARTYTYLFASFGQQVGGASAGINARPDARTGAIDAFVAEAAPLVEAGTFTTEAARGLQPEDLARLRDVDPAPLPTGEARDALLVAGLVAAAERCLGGLEGRTVAIEGWDQAPRAVAVALASRGAVVGVLGTAKATWTAPEGFDAELLGDPDADPAGVGESGPPEALWSAGADLLLAGSRAGVLDHTLIGEAPPARALVPWGPVPVTAKALAALRRQGVVVVPDFVALAGPALAAVGVVSGAADAGGAEAAGATGAVAGAVTGVLDEVMDEADGPLLGACRRAEAFLGTWRDELPFGRPIA
jgi:glutamate dehydrogenase (NAD(P)+)